MNFDTETVQKLQAWGRGEMTWAQVQGTTADEAREIAQVGCELAGAGRLEEARIVFEGLAELNPKDAAARAALGTVYQKLGRTDDAMAEYASALALDPKNPVALGNRGELLIRRGDQQGFIDLAEAVKADPHGETTAGRRARLIVQAVVDAAAEAAKPNRK